MRILDTTQNGCVSLCSSLFTDSSVIYSVLIEKYELNKIECDSEKSAVELFNLLSSPSYNF